MGMRSAAPAMVVSRTAPPSAVTVIARVIFIFRSPWYASKGPTARAAGRRRQLLCFWRTAFSELKASALLRRGLPLRAGLLLARRLLLRVRGALGELRAARLAVPFLEGLGLDLALDEELRELASLGLALEGHRYLGSGGGFLIRAARADSMISFSMRFVGSDAPAA